MKSEKTEQITITAGSRRIPATLHWRDRRTLGLSVAPGCKVEVYAPKRAERCEVENFLQKKAAWMARKLEEQKKYHPLPRPKQYISGESLTFLGRQYRLKVMPGKKVNAAKEGQYLLITVPGDNNNGTVKKAVENWYRQRAKEVFTEKLADGMKIAARHGINTEPELRIRKMKRRWGSCYTGGKIILNTSLIQVPMHCIEYVIMHELCHLKEGKHDKAFYSLLSRCMPDWRQRKEELNRVLL